MPQSTTNLVNDSWQQASNQQTVEQPRDNSVHSHAASGNNSPPVPSQNDQYSSPAQHSQSVNFQPQNLQVAQPTPSRKRSFTETSCSPGPQSHATTSRAQSAQSMPQLPSSSQAIEMQPHANGTPVLTPQQQAFSSDFQPQDLTYGDGGTPPSMMFGDLNYITDFTKTDSSISEDGSQRHVGLGVTVPIPGISPNSQATFPPTPPVVSYLDLHGFTTTGECSADYPYQSGSISSKTWPSSLSDEESVKFEETSGQTMLHLAAEKGHEGILRLLLERGGIDIDSRDSGGYTALHRAVQRGRMGIVQILLEHEADMGARTAQFAF